MLSAKETYKPKARRQLDFLLERALIVRQPWIGKILNLEKSWEMRSTKTKIRGRIGLIEAGTGLIVGEANLVDCHDQPISRINKVFGIHLHQVKDQSLLDKWCYAWVLKEVKKYKYPIPYNHPKGAVIWVDLRKQNILLPQE